MSIVLLPACSSTRIPDGLSAVAGFDLQRYLGTWYEIARFDHRFERGLQNVTATYSLNTDGSVKVVNRGILTKNGKTKSATGKAVFVGSEDRAHLKVSFFGPFYGGYTVFELDKINYDHALVAGPDRKYLWVLSRTATMDESLYQELVKKARDQGFDVEQLIRVQH